MVDGPYTRYPRTTLWLLRGEDFVMGGDAPDEQPRFEAETRSFYIGKAPITNEEYEVFCPEHARCEASNCDDTPAVNLSFWDAQAYCRWYSEATGKDFRLPTELEWEFACRGDEPSRYFWGDDPGRGDRYCWDAETSRARAQPVEGLEANKHGLHDLLGNVWEWTASLYLPYPIRDGDGRDDSVASGDRVARGGSFRSPRSELSTAVRLPLAPDTRQDDLGFRILRLL